MQTVSTGFVVAIVGFFSSFPIVLQGLSAMGADAAQAASGLMAAALAMGLSAIALSLWRRMPIGVAWSTPGAALLAVTAPTPDGFSGAVAGFIVAGVLTLIAGLWRPLGRLAASIPAPLAQAMLAGVLVSLCIAPFEALTKAPQTALPIMLTWFVMGRINRLFAVPAAVVAATVVTLIDVGFSVPLADGLLSKPVWTAPTFSWPVVVGIGLPLFIVTMATQNIPGVTILRSYDFTPEPGPLFGSVGAASVLSAPFGAPATCLSAITAVMCANEESHPDPAQRYWSTVSAGVFYSIFGLFAALITAFAAMAPAMTLETLTGVALLGVFANSTVAALQDADHREAAAITFLITASGAPLLGLSAAVWGLAAGVIVQAVNRKRA